MLFHILFLLEYNKLNEGDLNATFSLSKRIGYISQLESIPMTFTVE